MSRYFEKRERVVTPQDYDIGQGIDDLDEDPNWECSLCGCKAGTRVSRNLIRCERCMHQHEVLSK